MSVDVDEIERLALAARPDPIRSWADFAVAANPADVLSLVRELRDLRTIRDEVARCPRSTTATCHNDTIWICAYCGIDEVGGRVSRHREDCLFRRAVESISRVY